MFAVLVQGIRRVPETLHLRKVDDDTIQEVPVSEVKAVFFVKSFEGQGSRNDLKFFSNAPMVHGVWVQLQFKDGEIMEGIILNGMHHLTEPGFFVHPTDPDVAWVAALGAEWSDSSDRGVYKTEDGGKTWNRVLYVDPRTGAADMALDPRNPNKLFVSMWQFRR